ncbi:MAG: 4-hydroxy-tetrahydrodipicolinate reductase [Proteobacteria bacterium]|nr:4-hydroxy-tetrahydrodipicolinate reductase [Pseudomonadota bacterium]
MGREITRMANGRDDLRIVAAVERPGSPHLHKDLGEMAGIGPCNIVIGDDPKKAFDSADVAIDLSLPEATRKIIQTARESRTPIVCGTTGISDSTLAEINAATDEIPVLYAPNLSLGVAVTTALVEQAAKALGEDYDIEIVEMHHRDKVDAPSGTALALAEAAARSKGLDIKEGFRIGRAGNTGVRSRSEIGLHAVRGGGVFGEHTVILAGRHEKIEITHRASSRTLFAEGALRAAMFLYDKPPGKYTAADTL